MTLMGLLFSRRKKAFVAVAVLSVLSAVLSVAVLAFISQRLLAGGADLPVVLLQFALLLVALLVTATAAQMTLHVLGHRMVYGLRRDLVRRVLATDIEQLEKVGGPHLLAALSTDLRNLTIAFVHLPELVYGAALSVAALGWLAWLAPGLFAVTVAWLLGTAVMGIWLVGRINFHVGKVREGGDHLYQDYQSMIDGRKELALNRPRAARFFDEEFDGHARGYRDHVTRADICNGLAGNLANVLVLALIGVLFYLAAGRGWADANTASIFALTILLLRTPLIGAVAALPTLLAARVSLRKLTGLELADDTADLQAGGDTLAGFSTLSLQGVRYHYPDQDGAPGFSVGPLDLTIRRGELILVEDKTTLMDKLGQKELRLQLPEALTALPASLQRPGLTLEADGHTLVYTYDSHSEQGSVAALLRELSEAGIEFSDLQSRQSSLEDIFVSLVHEDAA